MNFGEAFDELLKNREMGISAAIRRDHWSRDIEVSIGEDEREKCGFFLKKSFGNGPYTKLYPDQEDLFAEDWEVIY